MSGIHIRLRSRVAAVTVIYLLVAGCAGTPKPLKVTGTVTFQGSPVGEGLVQFMDDVTGRGAEVELKPDGKYEAELFPGTYKVLVSPPYVVDNKSGIPNPSYKKVKNIPAKYHSTVSSGLSATVSPETTTFDFSLTP